MKLDMLKVTFDIECMEVWEKDVSGKSLNATEISYKYHKLEEELVDNTLTKYTEIINE